MNAGTLIEFLKTVPPTAEVVICKLNKYEIFAPVEKVGQGMFVPFEEPPFNGNIGEMRVARVGKENCVFLISPE